MNEFLSFNKMITPVIIQIIFWVAEVGCILFALYTLVKASFFIGLLYLVLFPLLVRVYCELMIVVFRMNESLETIKKNTGK